MFLIVQFLMQFWRFQATVFIQVKPVSAKKKNEILIPHGFYGPVGWQPLMRNNNLLTDNDWRLLSFLCLLWFFFLDTKSRLMWICQSTKLILLFLSRELVNGRRHLCVTSTLLRTAGLRSASSSGYPVPWGYTSLSRKSYFTGTNPFSNTAA